MNAGVSTSPCGVVIRPRRAAVPGSRFSTWNAKRPLASRARRAGRDALRRRLRQPEGFRLEAVLLDVGRPHRLEGAGADVQGQHGRGHARGGERLEELLGEMQPRRGRGDGALLARVDRLVALAIQDRPRIGVAALDVGRKWGRSVPPYGVLHVAVPAREPYAYPAVRSLPQELRLEALRDQKTRSRAQTARGRGQAAPGTPFRVL